MITTILEYKTFIENHITLYHGTCSGNGLELIKNGWKPRISGSGGNMGNPKYLYLSSEPEDALWFANEKGCDTIVVIKDIPLEYLRPDPEDEAGFSMDELLDRIKNTDMPSKFILTQPLLFNYFSLLKTNESNIILEKGFDIVDDKVVPNYGNSNNINTSLGKSTKNIKFQPRITTLPISKVKVYSIYQKTTENDVVDILKTIKKKSDKYSIDDLNYENFIGRSSIFFSKILKENNIDTILTMTSSSNLVKDVVSKTLTKFSDKNIVTFTDKIKKNIENIKVDFSDANIGEIGEKAVTKMLNKIKNDNHFEIKTIPGQYRKYFTDWIEINADISKNITNKDVIIFDDYITSGATLDECCKTLLKLSPKSIICLTLIK